jgi:hypothetical protein
VPPQKAAGRWRGCPTRGGAAPHCSRTGLQGAAAAANSINASLGRRAGAQSLAIRLPVRVTAHVPPPPRPPLTLQVHLQAHALGDGVLLDDVVHLLHIPPHPRLAAKILIEEVGEVALQLQPQLALLVHGAGDALNGLAERQGVPSRTLMFELARPAGWPGGAERSGATGQQHQTGQGMRIAGDGGAGRDDGAGLSFLLSRGGAELGPRAFDRGPVFPYNVGFGCAARCRRQPPVWLVLAVGWRAAYGAPAGGLHGAPAVRPGLRCPLERSHVAMHATVCRWAEAHDASPAAAASAAAASGCCCSCCCSPVAAAAAAAYSSSAAAWGQPGNPPLQQCRWGSTEGRRIARPQLPQPPSALPTHPPASQPAS